MKSSSPDASRIRSTRVGHNPLRLMYGRLTSSFHAFVARVPCQKYNHACLLHPPAGCGLWHCAVFRHCAKIHDLSRERYPKKNHPRLAFPCGSKGRVHQETPQTSRTDFADEGEGLGLNSRMNDVSNVLGTGGGPLQDFHGDCEGRRR